MFTLSGNYSQFSTSLHKCKPGQVVLKHPLLALKAGQTPGQKVTDFQNETFQRSSQSCGSKGSSLLQLKPQGS